MTNRSKVPLAVLPQARHGAKCLRRLLCCLVIPAVVLLASCNGEERLEIKVSGVSLDVTQLPLTVGQSVTLRATVAPAQAANRNVVWSSSNENMAGVDAAGNVTALSGGTAVITVTTEDGDKTGICDVTVQAAADNLLDSAYIPDPVFLNYCRRQMDLWDTDGNGKLTKEEAAAVTVMDVANINGNTIYSLKGIEWFTGIVTLNCYLNNLTSLNLSGCAALTELQCSSSGLTSLNVSGCGQLKRLNCGDCRLMELDLSGCRALMELHCYSNSLTVLDLSECPDLELLNADENNIFDIDVSANEKLKRLTCAYNALSSLDVSMCPSLKSLNVKDNKINLLSLPDSAALEELTCSSNRLNSLYVSRCPALRSLQCDDNGLLTLDVSKCRALTYLDCYDNGLSRLDVSANGSLTELYCDMNSIAELSVSANGALRSLVCNGNRISSLDVSANDALVYLNCETNSLSELDITNNGTLETLVCNGNRIVSLGIGAQNVRLRVVYSSDNRLDADTLNAIFGALPLTDTPDVMGTIYIDGNPGAESCDTNLALMNNWRVVY